MKTNFILIGFVILMASCKKVDNEIATYVQITTTDFFNGDSCPNIGFKIQEPYTSSNYGITDSTNDYGNYLGSFIHPDKAFELNLFAGYYLVGGNIQIINGENNIFELEVIPLSTFKLILDFSNTAEITNITRYRLIPITSESPVYNLPQGNSNVYSPYQQIIHPVEEVFYGEWVISYDWRPYTSSFWTEKSDTINILQGQDYIHTIVY